jgi:hypothetical protein
LKTLAKHLTIKLFKFWICALLGSAKTNILVGGVLSAILRRFATAWGFGRVTPCQPLLFAITMDCLALFLGS